MMADEKDVIRDKTLQMRVTDEERSIIEKKASELGLTVSNYMRLVCLRAKLSIIVDSGDS